MHDASAGVDHGFLISRVRRGSSRAKSNGGREVRLDALERAADARREGARVRARKGQGHGARRAAEIAGVDVGHVVEAHRLDERPVERAAVERVAQRRPHRRHARPRVDGREGVLTLFRRGDAADQREKVLDAEPLERDAVDLRSHRIGGVEPDRQADAPHPERGRRRPGEALQPGLVVEPRIVGGFDEVQRVELLRHRKSADAASIRPSSAWERIRSFR